MSDLGHYPYQAPIDAYGNGGFRFAGMSHRGSLLCLPSGMHGWSVTEPAGLSVEALQPVLTEGDSIDVLLIGLGPDIAAVPRGIRDLFRDKRVTVEGISTGSAVRTYNVLMAEQRAVAAALIAVERAR